MPRPFLNFHAHRPPVSPSETVLRNFIIPDETTDALRFPPDACFSAGIHPWHVPDDPEEAFRQLEGLAALAGCKAVGEAGLDALAAAPMPLQRALFVRQAELAAALRLPLIIHCVKAWSELAALKKSLPEGLPCVVHGFRGKPQLAESLLRQGFYLSFGFRFNPQSLLLCPPDRIFLETDEDPRPVEELYRTAANLCGCTPEKLRTQCLGNLARLTQLSKK